MNVTLRLGRSINETRTIFSSNGNTQPAVERETYMIQKILEECQKGLHGVGFNEVVLMIYNSVATAELYMNMNDVRFSDDGSTVTFIAENGTHLHVKWQWSRSSASNIPNGTGGDCQVTRFGSWRKTGILF